ncbi:MAG: YIP1 family protein [Chromatiales bacterium]|nr:YIP1 family protein [Chromatiales bacterium]
MVLNHVLGLFTNPRAEWQRIRDTECTVSQCIMGHVLILAAIPPIAGYIGTTQVGWTIGAGDPVKLSNTSAGMIAIAYFLAMVIGVMVMGRMIAWMAETYDVKVGFNRALALAAYTATPIFLVGIFQLYPALWLNFLVGLPALAYVVFLLYMGVPVMMEIPAERGFLMSSAILAVGLVGLVSLLAATAILWGLGFAPAFTN